ncbi:MAG TPA: tRNA (adenosine(37)-N6)-threonylcarbamoyltransferase complex ATPase subunit type 1 TsaE [Proteobacteria bacterium]|nr:tRNA (adenosine(37)-N6)-threonylcarbamoyltransferase complex ATPase subunit type 1 TsaE [Pseudomonadota bacterium]
MKRLPASSFLSSSPAETLDFAEALARGFVALKLYIVTLRGDLGAGKTWFTKGLARGLEVADWYYLNSPTFTLINEYQGRLPLYHFDLYRLSSAEELFELGFNDYLAAPGVLVIEWPEKVLDLLPTTNLIGIEIEILEAEKRLFQVRRGVL